MKSLILALLLITHAHAAELPARPSCTRQQESDPIIYRSDFPKWDNTLKEAAEKYTEMYQSPKRLKGRAYYDYRTRKYVFDFERGVVKTKVPIPPEFIRNVTKHVEIALQRRHADFVFFPDMGHSHFHYPLKYDELYKNEPDQAKTYARLLANPDLKILYHTAEMIPGKDKENKLIEDAETQWRYYTRNPTGDNQTGENIAIHYAWGENYNTVREIEGHGSWSSGFNISANKEGCFPFQHKGMTYYFDLSLEDLPYDPANESWGAIRDKFRSVWDHPIHPRDYQR